MTKRMFDLCLAGGLLLASLPVLALIALLVKFTSPGPVLYWSDRVGRYNRIFRMPKFRSMKVDAPQLATHLLADSRQWITPLGRILRKTSLDELPQLWSILVGDMSWVGPRPALFNQADLIALRTARGVEQVPVGLTGWAQINGRDDIAISKKVELDAWYVAHQSFWLDLQIMVLTAVKVFRQDGVRQADDEQHGAPQAGPQSTLRKAA